MLTDGDAQVAVEGLKTTSIASPRGDSGLVTAASRARYGTRNGQRIRPRNWTSDASTPITTPRMTTVASASSRAIPSSTASGANSTAESANTHQIRIRELPPARKRSRTSWLGRRSTSG